jgi:hypothetical protein
MMDRYDWRQHKRERCEGTVEITVSVIKSHEIEQVCLRVKTVDISPGGLGIVSDVPLEPGFVRLRGMNENRNGFVMWNRNIDDTTYRAGIRFDNPFMVK